MSFLLLVLLYCLLVKFDENGEVLRMTCNVDVLGRKNGVRTIIIIILTENYRMTMLNFFPLTFTREQILKSDKYYIDRLND